MSEGGLCPPQCAKNVNPTCRKSLNPLCEGTEEGVEIEAQPGGEGFDGTPRNRQIPGRFASGPRSVAIA